MATTLLQVRSLIRGVAAAPASCQAALLRVQHVYNLSLFQRRMSDFTADGFVSATQAAAVERLLMEQLPFMRVEAVPLIECFGHHDMELNSAIGPKDGRLYERLLQWAKEDPMNEAPVVDGFAESLGPMLAAARATLLRESGMDLSNGNSYGGLVQQPARSGRHGHSKL